MAVDAMQSMTPLKKATDHARFAMACAFLFAGCLRIILKEMTTTRPARRTTHPAGAANRWTRFSNGVGGARKPTKLMATRVIWKAKPKRKARIRFRRDIFVSSAGLKGQALRKSSIGTT